LNNFTTAEARNNWATAGTQMLLGAHKYNERQQLQEFQQHQKRQQECEQ
jgi:hypothetical protein